MSTFRDLTWAEREGGMGDMAEAKFREVYPRNFIRAGLDRPPLQVWKLPPEERYRPDFLTSTSYVEVQGFGRDQVLKVKLDKLMALAFWHRLHPVELFIFDSYNDRWTIVPLPQVIEWAEAASSLRRFREGTAYFAIPAYVIFDDDNSRAQG